MHTCTQYVHMHTLTSLTLMLEGILLPTLMARRLPVVVAAVVAAALIELVMAAWRRTNMMI